MAAPRSWPATRITVAFGLLAVAMLSLVGLAWQTYTDLLEAQHFRARSDELAAALLQLGAEAQPDAQRTICAATGGPSVPGPEVPAWPATMLRLQGLLVDDAAQSQRAAELHRDLRQWEQQYATPLRQACAEGVGLGATEVLARSRLALPMRTRIVDGLAQLQRAAQAQRREREDRLSQRVDASRLALALLSVAALVLGAIAVVVVRSFTLRVAEGNRKLFGEAQRRALVQDRLTLSQRRMRVLLDHIPDAVIAFDARGRVQWINPIGESMFGAPRRVLLGRPMAMLMPGLDDELQWPNTEPQPLQAGEAEAEDSDMALPWTARHMQVEALRLRAGGAEAERFPVDVSLVQTRAEGHRVGVCVARDLSEVQRVERMKHEFVSMVSHELRTPLTSIHGSLALLSESGDALEPSVQRLVKLAYDNSERLVALVNDILDFEKLRAGQLRLEPIELDLREAALVAANTCEGMAQRRAVRIVVEHGETALTLHADPLRLNQVLANLLSNAIKFSPAGSDVRLVVERSSGDFARATVTDHGPGVPPAFVERLFEPFAQAANLDTRKQGGTGLGLAISRALIERMGGRIGLEAPQPGRGAVFWIELPLRPPPEGS